MFESFAESLVEAFGQVTYILPQVIVLIAALLAPLLHFATKDGKIVAGASFAIIAISAILVMIMMHTVTYGTAFGMFEFDPFSSLMMLLFMAVAFLTIMVSPVHVETTKHAGEYYSLIAAIVAGMMFAASATTLLAIFIGVEVVSISSYALVALKKNDPRASEAAVKYLIIGAFSSALTLLGMSMIYGVTGTLDIEAIGAKVAVMGANWAFILGCIGMIAGYGFKIAAVPFHSWAPDVYEGASAPVSGFLATASKKMGFAVMFKIFFALFVLSHCVFIEEFQYVFAILAAITMTVGNLVAISQSNIKRMLAYSSVAQAGYIMIALAIMSQYATTGALFHMFTHVVMKGGAFIMVAALITAGLGEKIEDYKGLAKRAPLLAAAMMLFLFSLAGIPPLAGFTSKFVLFSGAIFVDGAVSMQWMWLAFIAVINSAISLYYYARVVKTMYIEKPACDDKIVVPAPFMVAIALCVIGVIVLGVYPEILLELCDKAAAALF